MQPDHCVHHNVAVVRQQLVPAPPLVLQLESSYHLMGTISQPISYTSVGHNAMSAGAGKARDDPAERVLPMFAGPP